MKNGEKTERNGKKQEEMGKAGIYLKSTLKEYKKFPKSIQKVSKKSIQKSKTKVSEKYPKSI